MKNILFFFLKMLLLNKIIFFLRNNHFGDEDEDNDIIEIVAIQLHNFIVNLDEENLFAIKGPCYDLFDVKYKEMIIWNFLEKKEHAFSYELVKKLTKYFFENKIEIFSEENINTVYNKLYNKKDKFFISFFDSL